MFHSRPVLRALIAIVLAAATVTYTTAQATASTLNELQGPSTEAAPNKTQAMANDSAIGSLNYMRATINNTGAISLIGRIQWG